MSTHNEIVYRWLDICLGGKNRMLSTNCSNIKVYDGQPDRIYSWGQHFEIARLLRKKNGKPRLFLLNGDQNSSSTSGHQWTVRRIVQNCEVPVLIVPFSSLESAGIDKETIQPLFIEKDGWEDIVHQSSMMPHGAEYVRHWNEPRFDLHITHHQPLHPSRFFRKYDSDAKEWRDAWSQVKLKNKQESVYELGLFSKSYIPGSKVVYRQILGDTFSEHPQKTLGYLNPVHEIDGVFYWKTKRHTLGDSAFRCKLTERRKIRASCIACKGTGFEDKGNTHPSTHWRRPCRNCVGGRKTKTHKRWATMLSSFDQQERGRFYFLCEMPHNSMPKTLDEALEMLKPEAVKMAEMTNRLVLRQGDIFFIKTRLTDRQVMDGAKLIGAARGRADLKAARKRWDVASEEDRRWRTNPYKQLPQLTLLNQRHSATRVAHMKYGVELAKGRAYHLGGEHSPFDLGDKDSWFVVVKNTCPITKR